jgi:hypothetical protein
MAAAHRYVETRRKRGNVVIDALSAAGNGDDRL